MLRLTLVHGRGQGDREAETLRSEWLSALNSGLEAACLPPLGDDVDVQFPYYATVLDELSAAPTPRTDDVVAKGPNERGNRFTAAFVLELAERAGVDDEEVVDELGQAPIKKGAENWPWVLATGRVLDRKTPWFGRGLLRLLVSDVDAYLNRLYVRKAVNNTVAPVIIEQPTVVVAHSLGSIIAYCVLIEQEQYTQVPLFATVGCPLGMHTVKNLLPRPLRKPRGASAWFNAADVRDPIAMVPRLDRDAFPAEIENVSDVHNPEYNPHGIAGYLADPVVARHIAMAVSP